MSLQDDAWLVWERLKEPWLKYLSEVGLDLRDTSPETFRKDLHREIKAHTDVSGFEDFSREGKRGVEPGDPALSVLYHAWASPGVVPAGIDEAHYPTLAELEIIENFIYSFVPPSIADIRKKAGGGPLAVAVFAYEYTMAIDTVHRRHADFCFSRTGISRAGTVPAKYLRKSRGYLPEHGAKSEVSVVPCRFGVFLATQETGDPESIGPERFQEGDEKRKFWVPVHKLFDGDECIDGVPNLRLEWKATHVNEKIRRVHLALAEEKIKTPWQGAALEEEPFRITKNIAELSKVPEDGQGLLMPVPQPLIEPARKDGKYVTFPVPAKHDALQASLWFKGQPKARRWPEFVHAKHTVIDGEIVNLADSTDKSIQEIVSTGGYEALHFLDHLGEGWVEARCRALALQVPKRLPAYSLVGQPDFFPLVKQQDLMEWWELSAPEDIKEKIWSGLETQPKPLSGSRLPPNLVLPEGPFQSGDETATAVVGVGRTAAKACRLRPMLIQRESCLSYRATNLFEPGWDCSTDINKVLDSPDGVQHLSQYGLSSPFAEDTMICAADGAYWPGAVPDTSRFFAPHVYPSITPCVDGTEGFDGVEPPKILPDAVEYTRFQYADYVRAMWQKEFDFRQFEKVTVPDYVARTLAMARIYHLLGVAKLEDRALWAVLSFAPVQEADLGQVTNEKLRGLLVPGEAFKVEMVTYSASEAVKGQPRRVRKKVEKREKFMADAVAVLRWDAQRNDWTGKQF